MKILIILTACIGLLMAGTVQAKSVVVNQKYSGVTHATSMEDTNGDGIYAVAVRFHLVGSPGRSTAESVGEFTDYYFTGVTGCELRSDVIWESWVQTFNDLSMLFSPVTEGFICVNLFTGEVWGEIIGDFDGGTGRFQGATGDYIIEFEGYAATPYQNAFEGTVKGLIELPD